MHGYKNFKYFYPLQVLATLLILNAALTRMHKWLQLATEGDREAKRTCPGSQQEGGSSHGLILRPTV